MACLAVAYPKCGAWRAERPEPESVPTPKVCTTTPAPVSLLRPYWGRMLTPFPGRISRMGDGWETIIVTIRAVPLTSARFR